MIFLITLMPNIQFLFTTHKKIDSRAWLYFIIIRKHLSLVMAEFKDTDTNCDGVNIENCDAVKNIISVLKLYDAYNENDSELLQQLKNFGGSV